MLKLFEIKIFSEGFKEMRYNIKNFFNSQFYLIGLMFTTCPVRTVIYWLLTAAVEAIPIVNVWIWKLILDEMTLIYTGKEADGRVYLLLAAFLGLSLIASLFGNVKNFLKGEIADYSNRRLDEELMRQGARLESEYFNNPVNGGRIWWAQHSQRTVVQNFTWTVDTALQIASFVTAAGLFLAYSPVFGVIFLITYIPGAVVLYRSGKKIENWQQWHAPDNVKKEYFKEMLISSKSAKDIRLYNLAPYLREKYDAIWSKLRREHSALFRESTVKAAAASLLSCAGLAAVIVMSVRNLLNGSMAAIGTFSLYIGYAKTAGSSFSTIMNSVIRQYTVEAHRVRQYREFCTQPPLIPDNGTLEAPRMPRVEFRNVTFTYPTSDKPAIEDMSFVIEPGEVIGLVGVNGAGKTTIVRLLLRFYEPQSGEILLNGTDIRDFTMSSLWSVFGVCFQEVEHYAMKLRENVTLSDITREDDMESVEWSARMSGLDKVMKNWEDGWDTMMTRGFADDGKELSGGQWQKIGLSRTFFGDADIMILDEPSSALDAEAEDRIFSSFSELCRSKGGILISHRLSSVMMVDRIFFINGGQIVECGSHEELMKNGGEYARLYKLQAEKYVGGAD